MNEITKHALVDDACSTCGSKNFVRAQDKTHYSDCELVDGEWLYQRTTVLPMEDEDAVRFYCIDCGTEHQVPDDLL